MSAWIGAIVLVIAPSAMGSGAPQPTAASSAAEPPPSLTNIGRFGLGVPIASVTAALGTAHEGVDDVGAPYYGYRFTGSETQIVYRTAPFRREFVFGVQISGEANPKVLPVHGVGLGDPATKILENIGEPSSKARVEGLNRTLWVYEGRNYSFEVDQAQQVVSIAVLGYDGVMTGKGWPKNWERYRPHSLGAVIERYRTSPEDAASAKKRYYGLVPIGVPVRPRVIYTGTFRETDPLVLEHLEHWWKSTDRGESRVSHYRQSMMVVEAGSQRWVAVQDSLIESMREELRPGDPVDLFVIFAGQVGGEGVPPESHLPSMFVNEFCGCSWEDRGPAAQRSEPGVKP